MNFTSQSAHVPLAVALVFGVAISLGGCAAESSGNGGGAGTSQADPGATTDSGEKAPAEDGGSKGFVDEDGVVPDWVAAGFPIYPGSRAGADAKAGGKTIIGFSAGSAEAQVIFDWFLDQYSQNGWDIQNREDVGTNFAATNTDGRTASIDITKSTFVMTVSEG